MMRVKINNFNFNFNFNFNGITKEVCFLIFRCVLDTGSNPFSPIKVEILSSDPLVIMAHDVLSKSKFKKHIFDTFNDCRQGFSYFDYKLFRTRMRASFNIFTVAFELFL